MPEPEACQCETANSEAFSSSRAGSLLGKTSTDQQQNTTYVVFCCWSVLVFPSRDPALELLNASLLAVSHWHASGSGTGSVPESQNLGAVWRTGPLSHQFKWNQSGRTSFRVTQAEVNTATAKWQECGLFTSVCFVTAAICSVF